MVAEIRQPAIMQLLSLAGFDFAIIDNEHGPFNIETIADLSRAGRCYGVTPIVRAGFGLPYLAQSLDVGAQGIMLPRVYTVEQVKEAVQIVKYPPQGCAAVHSTGATPTSSPAPCSTSWRARIRKI
ncbi:MAG: aldolase/citrate lyase family protein [Caldilineaceae bacterium]